MLVKGGQCCVSGTWYVLLARLRDTSLASLKLLVLRLSPFQRIHQFLTNARCQTLNKVKMSERRMHSFSWCALCPMNCQTDTHFAASWDVAFYLGTVVDGMVLFQLQKESTTYIYITYPWWDKRLYIVEGVGVVGCGACYHRTTRHNLTLNDSNLELCNQFQNMRYLQMRSMHR